MGVKVKTSYLMVPLAGILAFAVLYYIGFSTGEAFYLAFTFASTVGAVVAISEKEQSLLDVTAFGALLLVLAIIPYLSGIAPSTLTIITPTAQITIPTNMIPWICLGLVGFMAVAVTVGANAGAIGLWVLSDILVILYYVVPDPITKLFSIIMVAVIATYPMLRTTTTGKYAYGLLGLGLLPVSNTFKTEFVINLSTINPYAVMLLPILTFISLDPFNAIKNRLVKDIGAVLATFVVLLHVIDMFLAS
jgi:hypothetical protein